MLHILNGDALLEFFPTDSQITGERHIFRDCLIEGPAEAFEDLSDFLMSRASYVNQEYGAEIDQHLQHFYHLIKALNDAPAEEEIVLWFEDDVFCQTNMWYSIYLLIHQCSSMKRNISWVRSTSMKFGFAALDQQALIEAFNSRKKLNTEELLTLSALWRAYAKKDYSGMRGLFHKARKIDPVFDDVIQAILDAELLNEQTKRSRPEQRMHEILEALGEEKTHFGKAFNLFSEQEAIYGYGDTQVKRIYDKVMTELKTKL
jgi:hypothetical protein